MSDRKETLLKNTALFAIGSIGSKLLQIILVPFYTRFMLEAEYGTTDLMQAVVSLLLPILSLSIYEAVFRFAMDKDSDSREVLSAGLFVTLVGTAVLSLAAVVLPGSVNRQFVWLVVMNAVANAFRSLYSQYARAVGRVKLFTADNILLTALVLVLNIVFIAVLHLGVTGYMLGYICANLLSCLFLRVSLGRSGRTSLLRLKGAVLRTLLMFSLPLVPNAICWWLANFTDRIMIVSIVGAAENGVYAAAHKIPSLLYTLMTVFFQAWQISANKEFKARDIGAFYSDTFRQISALLFLASAVLIGLCRDISQIFLGSAFRSAWLYMPPLVLSVLFFSFGQFLGSVYSANKKTVMSFVTNLLSVAVNVVLNLLLIPRFGALGAAAATAASYLAMWLARVVSTGKIVAMEYDGITVLLSVLVLVSEAVLVCADLGRAVMYAAGLAAVAVLMLLHRRSIAVMLKFFLSLANKIFKRT